MSKRYETELIAERLAEALQLPRPKMDTAAVLDVYPNQFSAMMLGAIIGGLSLFLAYMSRAVGSTAGTRAIAPFGVVLGVIGLSVAVAMLLRIKAARSQYADERAFGNAVIARVLSQPSAPNWHLFERVGLRQALGNPEAADASVALHEWTQARRQQISDALVAAAGISADARIHKTGPEIAIEVLPPRLFGKLGDTLQVSAQDVQVGGHAVKVWEIEQPVLFQYRVQEQQLDKLSPAGQKLSDAGAPFTATAVITRTPADDWYVLAADLVPAQA